MTENVTTQPPRLALSIVEAAQSIGLGRSTIYEAISSKNLPTYKVGGRRLVRPGDLSAWLEKYAAN